LIRIGVAAVLLLLVPDVRQAAAQAPFEAGAQVVVVSSGEFDTTDVGFGGRFGWKMSPLLGVEAEMSFFPQNLDDRVRDFSASRVEGLFGVTVGPVLGRVRPFAKARPGFVNFSEASGPLICIAIFPPTLPCAMAGGDTVFAFDVGGGVEFFPSDRTFIRLDLGDRLLRYHGPAIDSDREVHDDTFFGHDLRLAVGGGIRF
jgi:hypothetical protein